MYNAQEQIKERLALVQATKRLVAHPDYQTVIKVHYVEAQKQSTLDRLLQSKLQGTQDTLSDEILTAVLYFEYFIQNLLDEEVSLQQDLDTLNHYGEYDE